MPCFVITHDAEDVCPQGHHARAGERGEIEQFRRIMLQRHINHIGQHKATFSIGIKHFNRFAAASLEHVAQFETISADHILHESA